MIGLIIAILAFPVFSAIVLERKFESTIKLYPVKRTRERVTFEPTSPVYGR